jgi:hypothetical protein
LPELPVPTRPQLVEVTAEEAAKMPADVREKLIGNITKMHRYTEQLEVGVKRYNTYAEVNNEMVRKELGIPSLKQDDPAVGK